jgi:hypothetical protein
MKKAIDAGCEDAKFRRPDTTQSRRHRFLIAVMLAG